MLYEKLENLPDNVKTKLPQDAQKTFRKAANDAYEEYGDEDVANEIALSVIKGLYEKNDKEKWIKRKGNRTLSIQKDDKRDIKTYVIKDSKKNYLMGINLEDGVINVNTQEDTSELSEELLGEIELKETELAVKAKGAGYKPWDGNKLYRQGFAYTGDTFDAWMLFHHVPNVNAKHELLPIDENELDDAISRLGGWAWRNKPLPVFPSKDAKKQAKMHLREHLLDPDYKGIKQWELPRHLMNEEDEKVSDERRKAYGYYAENYSKDGKIDTDKLIELEEKFGRPKHRTSQTDVEREILLNDETESVMLVSTDTAELTEVRPGVFEKQILKYGEYVAPWAPDDKREKMVISILF